jgi:integrase/recombinase XerC
MRHIFLVGGIWHYRFQVAGVRVHRTTRQVDKGRAELVAQRAFDDAVTRANGGQPIPSLSALAEEWIKIRGQVVSASHLKGMQEFVRRHTYGLGNLPISELTTERVELARNEHMKTRSPATANHWLRILNLLVNWAVKREILTKLPWKVSMLRVQRKPRATLPIEMVKAWFDALDKAAGKAPAVGTAVRLMFGLGLRESEAAGARWEWIDWDRRTYTPGVTKGREATAIPMPRWIAERLGAARRKDGLIVARRDGQQLPPGYPRHAIRAANAACGIDGITSHRLRGTFATLLSEEGTPIQTIQAIMRHKDVKTTMAYLETNLDSAARAQERIEERIGLLA